MSPVLKEIIGSIPRGPKAAREALERNKEKLTAAMAREARELYTKAAAEGRLADAMVIAGIAATIFLEVGEMREHLRCRIDMSQCEFLGAETLSEYMSAKETLDTLAAHAASAGEREVRFEALVMGADCMYFAIDATDDLGTRGALLYNVLMQLVAVLPLAPAALDTSPFSQRFVSLASGIVKMVIDRGQYAGAQKAVVEVMLRNAAESLETLVPLDYELPDDLDRTTSVARNLAELSRRYGSAEKGQARLKAIGNRL